MTTAEQRLTDVLRAEHAAIYAYGALGGHLDPANVTLAGQAETAHRARRDALIIRLSSTGATPPVADPVYALPSAVVDQPSALHLMITVENRTATAWRTALPDTTGTDRKLALDGLSDCAVRATRARRAAGIEPATVAFPGKA